MPTPDVDCLYVSPQQQLQLHRCGNFPTAFLAAISPFLAPTRPDREPTFDNIAVDSSFELLSGRLVEVLAVDDPHLFEESRLAALAGPEQQDLYQPLYVRFLPGEASVDLLGLPYLLYLAVVEQTDGQTNF